MSDQAKIFDQHRENTGFSSKLKFYKEELAILQERLAEITAKNSRQEVMKEVEHFQNQFIIQPKNADEIGRMVGLNEKQLQEEISKNPTAVDHRSTKDHSKERELVEGFEKNLNQLREEFKRFAAKWI